MSTDASENIVKVIAEYVNDDGATSAEGLRAAALGDQLYELRNIPVMASGYHLFDVVRCVEPEGEDLCPVAKEVVTPGGHRTWGIVFADTVPRERQADMLMALYNRFPAVYHERVSDTHLALSIPQADTEALTNLLSAWKDAGDLLDFEELR